MKSLILPHKVFVESASDRVANEHDILSVQNANNVFS